MHLVYAARTREPFSEPDHQRDCRADGPSALRWLRLRDGDGRLWDGLPNRWLWLLPGTFTFIRSSRYSRRLEAFLHGLIVGCYLWRLGCYSVWPFYIV
jgi:hypothetical protein